MSLESNLELNNKLVAEQNGLLTQLLAALAGGKTFTADTPHQPKAESKTGTAGKDARKGPFFWKSLDGLQLGEVSNLAGLEAITEANAGVEINKVEFLQRKEEAEKAPKVEPLTLEAQPLPIAVALAAAYGEVARQLTPEMLEDATALVETATGVDRDEQIDALTMALKGVDRAKKLHGAGVFDLALQLVEHWDALPGITERRAYAELLLDTPKEKRADVKPAKPKATGKGKATTTETVATTDGEAPDAAALLEQGKQLIIQKIAPKAPADLRKTLDLFGLKKLTDCPAEKLPDVVAALEQLAEALEA